MTKRRYLTKKERAQMALNQQGLCGCGCGKKLGPDSIGEHWTMVAWDNEAKPDCLLTKDCAARKTKTDMAKIAKVKRIIRKRNGTWRPNRPKFQNPGFNKALTKKFDGTVVRRAEK